MDHPERQELWDQWDDQPRIANRHLLICVQSAQLDRLDLLELLDPLETMDRRVNLEVLVNRETMAALGHLAHLDRREHLEWTERLEIPDLMPKRHHLFPAILETPEMLDRLALPAQPEHLGRTELKALLAIKVRKVKMVNPARMGNLVKLAQQVKPVLLAKRAFAQLIARATAECSLSIALAEFVIANKLGLCLIWLRFCCW